MFGAVRDVVSLLRGYGVHMGDLPAVLAGRYEDRPALVAPGGDDRAGLSFAELEVAVARAAAAYRVLGLVPGSVAVVAASGPAVLLHACALSRAGTGVGLVDPALGAEAVGSFARAVGADVVVVGPDAASDLSALEGPRVIVTDPVPGVGAPVVSTTAAADPAAGLPPTEADPELPVLYLPVDDTGEFAVELTSHGLLSGVGRLALAPVGRRNRPRRGRDLVVCARPVSRVIGLTAALGAMCAGVPLVLADDEVADLTEVVLRRDANVVVADAATYATMTIGELETGALTSVQVWISAGTPIEPRVARRLQSAGAAARLGGRTLGTAALVDVYGRVELAGPVAVRIYPPSLVTPVPTPPMWVTLPGVEARVVDGSGAPVGWGLRGDLQLRGPGSLTRYLGAGATEVPRAGWVATGDRARLWPGDAFTLVDD